MPSNRPENREIIFWDCNPDQEELRHETIDDAIESYLEDYYDEQYPEIIMCYGFARALVSCENIQILEYLLEHLDEQYNNPDNGFTEPTETMKQAEETFKSAVASEYRPWACDQITAVKINVQQWISENRPHWAKPPENII